MAFARNHEIKSFEERLSKSVKRPEIIRLAVSPTRSCHQKRRGAIVVTDCPKGWGTPLFEVGALIIVASQKVVYCVAPILSQGVIQFVLFHLELKTSVRCTRRRAPDGVAHLWQG